MRVAGEQISDWLTPVNFGFALADELPESVGLKMALESRFARHATRRRLAAVVVLHLRSRYVSKAAILTIPVLLVSVENRSPALIPRAWIARRRFVATVFPLRV